MSQEVVRGDAFYVVFYMGPCGTLIRGQPFCNHVSGRGSGRHGALWGPNWGRAILYCILLGALIRIAILYCILHGALWGLKRGEATSVAGPGSVLLCPCSDSDRRVGYLGSGSPWGPNLLNIHFVIMSQELVRG